MSAPTYRPIPPKIERPTIPNEPAEFTEREKILVDYAHRLELMYNTVRADTIQHNEQAGFPVPAE